MKRPLLIIAGLFFITLVLSIVRVAVVNTIATNGQDLVSLQMEIDNYKKQNIVLKEQYLELSSLTTIDQKAKQLGFVEVNQNLNLSTPLPLALGN